MCLGVPMRIKEINGYTARCEARGIERTASLFLLQHEELYGHYAVLTKVL